VTNILGVVTNNSWRLYQVSTAQAAPSNLT
jgi:hypothetical protein